MATQAKEILHRASVLLQDSGSVRWTPSELCDYLNDGQFEVANLKPSAVAESVEMTLEKGTRQTLPTEYAKLLGVLRNLDTVDVDVEGRAGGRAIRMVDRHVLDAQIVGWQDPDVLAYDSEVKHVVYEPSAPREFFVVPGNDGTGVIEITVAVRPTDITKPADILNIDSYTDAISLDDLYRGALTDYVLYRAYSKDSETPNAAQRAQMHYQQFQNIVGVKQSTDQAMNPSTHHDG